MYELKLLTIYNDFSFGAIYNETSIIYWTHFAIYWFSGHKTKQMLAQNSGHLIDS
jgi:hypothetical protein